MKKSCKELKIGVYVLMHLHGAFVPISLLAMTGSVFGSLLVFTVLVRVLSPPEHAVP